MPQYEDVYDPPVLDSTFAEKIDELKDALAPPIPDFVSDAFSVSRAYAVGEYCIYENHFYKFTSAKSAGAWDSTKVQETTLVSEQSSTNSNLAQKTAIKEKTVTGTTNSYGAINLSLPWATNEIISVTSSVNTQWIFPFSIGSSTYARVLSDVGTWTVIPNTSVTLTVRYREYTVSP